MNSLRFRGAVRHLLALIATLQVVVTMGGPLIDAEFERRSQGAVAHLESTTAATCVAHHDHDLCALCRELGRSKVASPPATIIAFAPHGGALHADRITDDAAGRFADPLGSRAPPGG